MEVRALIHSLEALFLENAVCAHCIGGWVGRFEEEEIYCPCQDGDTLKLILMK